LFPTVREFRFEEHVLSLRVEVVDANDRDARCPGAGIELDHDRLGRVGGPPFQADDEGKAQMNDCVSLFEQLPGARWRTRHQWLAVLAEHEYSVLELTLH
jgi:hypothetical protein